MFFTFWSVGTERHGGGFGAPVGARSTAKSEIKEGPRPRPLWTHDPSRWEKGASEIGRLERGKTADAGGYVREREPVAGAGRRQPLRPGSLVRRAPAPVADPW